MGHANVPVLYPYSFSYFGDQTQYRKTQEKQFAAEGKDYLVMEVRYHGYGFWALA